MSFRIRDFEYAWQHFAMSHQKKNPPDPDPTASSRKRDHIALAFQSQIESDRMDARFNYEPMLGAHAQPHEVLEPFEFLGKTLRLPIWVSSMTGGTTWARTINYNLAKACREFGMGMGLGSCRALLYSEEHLPDFDVRDVIGDELPLYANLGIAQVEKLIDKGELGRIDEMLARLRVDGLIVHVNPLQEFLQPEGDRLMQPPIETIQRLLAQATYPIIVKEVGQGFGPRSMEALLQLPLAAVDFGAAGGTNFSMLELLRSDPQRQEAFQALARVGHTATEMVEMVNALAAKLGEHMRCQQIIVSGGVRNFLDGHYLLSKLNLPAVYGQASAFLRYAREDYEVLKKYVQAQAEGLALARTFLDVKP